MNIILVLSIAVLVLWIIPVIYVIQCRSWRLYLEVVFLLLVSVGLPFAVNLLEEQIYGLAAGISLEEALSIAGLQLIFWLGAIVLVVRATACRIPSRYRLKSERQAPGEVAHSAAPR